ncbi:MAG: SDR family oxidoreductase [Verrucomicrobia bacterium]|nr:SDR family oxidoreductase [Verrucomicrobiota bacterium]
MGSVVITGAAGGLGRELAAAFARAGWALGLMGHSTPEALHELAASLEPPQAATACCDVRDAAAVDAAFARFDEALGGLDVLVHTAAISPPGLVATVAPEAFDEQIEVNLTGAFHCVRAAIVRMLPRHDGHIITIGSYWGAHGLYGGAAYSASKAGLVGLTLSAAHEVGRKGIRCNVVLPGFLRTPMTAGLKERDVARAVAGNVLGRASDFDEVCAFVVGLAAMRHVSAQVFNLDSRPARL